MACVWRVVVVSCCWLGWMGCESMVVGCCGLWCVGVGLQCIGKNYNPTISITNDGAKRSNFFKMYKNVHLGEMGVFVHLENGSMIFTDSYVRGVHLGEVQFCTSLRDVNGHQNVNVIWYINFS